MCTFGSYLTAQQAIDVTGILGHVYIVISLKKG